MRCWIESELMIMTCVGQLGKVDRRMRESKAGFQTGGADGRPVTVGTTWFAGRWNEFICRPWYNYMLG